VYLSVCSDGVLDWLAVLDNRGTIHMILRASIYLHVLHHNDVLCTEELPLVTDILSRHLRQNIPYNNTSILSTSIYDPCRYLTGSDAIESIDHTTYVEGCCS